jgi:hypothetical protein
VVAVPANGDYGARFVVVEKDGVAPPM